MSLPARDLRAARPSARPRPPRRAGAARPAARTSRPATRARRRRHHLGFALFASALVGAMVFSIVVLHVLLAQQSFRLDEAERRLDVLATEHLELVREQAALSAPGRIAAWADRHGMRLPDDIRILRAPSGQEDPAGTGTADGPPGAEEGA